MVPATSDSGVRPAQDSVLDGVNQEMAEKLTTLPVSEDFLHDNVTVDENARIPDLVDGTSG